MQEKPDPPSSKGNEIKSSCNLQLTLDKYYGRRQACANRLFVTASTRKISNQGWFYSLTYFYLKTNVYLLSENLATKVLQTL